MNPQEVSDSLNKMIKLFDSAKGKSTGLSVDNLTDSQIGLGFNLDDMFCLDKGKEFLQLVNAENQYDARVCAYRVAVAKKIGLTLSDEVPVYGLISSKVVANLPEGQVTFVKSEPNNFLKFKSFRTIADWSLKNLIDRSDLSALFGVSKAQLISISNRALK